MTPAVVTAEQWQQINQTLIWFWAFLGCIVVFAANMLVAYAIIPSLVSTRDLPAKVAAIRPVLFALAAIFLIAAVFAFVNVVNGIQVLYEIWPRRWI
jgi:energy-coupling factor transporter transmembrane protein EcfT